MSNDKDAAARPERPTRRSWVINAFYHEWLLQLALFCAVVTALIDSTASIGGGTIA